jgi:hypothetical protein
MALLIGISRSRGLRTALLALAAAALAGCVLFEAFDGEERRFAFSHRIHAEEGLDCTTCHLQAESADEPGLPNARQCALCHEEIDSEKPPERRVGQFFGEDKKFRSARRFALHDEVVFPHLRHATAESLECSSCHGAVETNDDVLELDPLSMRDCTQCHAGAGAPNECSTCHSVLREDVAPASHDRLWMRRHGSVVCERGDRTADDCSMCHGESTCVACHLEMPPANHTNHFRLKTHGVIAALDRQSCATCHRAESCDQCHQETAPMSHTGAWGAPVDRHCLSCHFPIQQESCFVCHKGTPSHALAPPKPPDHNPAMNCRLCHGMGQPLPHVDNGDNCNICHQ